MLRVALLLGGPAKDCKCNETGLVIMCDDRLHAYVNVLLVPAEGTLPVGPSCARSGK